jgi:hypothetical protein
LNSASTVELQHNLLPSSFKWLWMKYVTGVNDKYHCTNCLRGKYGKTLSKHNEQLATTSVVLLDEMPLESYSAIYVCGVINRGYPRTNYVHNLHAVIRPFQGQCDEFSFENWHLKVKNGFFDPIPSENDLPEQYRSLPLEFTTCRIFRWAVCSALNINMSEMEE